MMGLIQMERKSYEEAAATFREVLDQDPNDQNSRLNLGLSLEELGRYEEALANFSKISREDPLYQEGLIHRGYVATLLGKLDEAIAAYQESLISNSDRASIHFFLGLTYMRKKDYGQAIVSLERAKSLDPSKEDYCFQLGAAYERNEELEKAEREFKEVLRINPNHAEAYNYLGYMYADRGIKLDEAISHIQKALVLEPSNGAFVDSLGWAYFKKGMLDEAIRELNRSIGLLTKDDATIHEHLGDAYFEKGLIGKAISEWEKSLQLESDNREEIGKKIEEGKRRLILNPNPDQE